MCKLLHNSIFYDKFLSPSICHLLHPSEILALHVPFASHRMLLVTKTHHQRELDVVNKDEASEIGQVGYNTIT